VFKHVTVIRSLSVGKRSHVLFLSFKLDNAVVGRCFSLQDKEFFEFVAADIKQFVNRCRKSRR
jgi:hypothetical protein